MADLRVLVAADDPLARVGLAALLAEEAGCRVVGQAASVDDLAAAAQAHRPEVVLWDAGWASGPAFERLSEAADALPPIAALLADATLARPAWQAGARALLRRASAASRLVVALAALAHGLAVVEPEFAAALREASAEDAPAGAAEAAGRPALVESLTPRELEVLRLLAEGLPNKTVAARLGISEHTVKFHVNTLMGKLGVASRTEAVVRATRLGLIWL
jgi:DNA-binding NarL/FixJ family response regulator